jgi:hypothetical protein
MPGDEENAPRRLVIVSAGNITPETDFTKIKPQDDYPIEDPAQAWNALTVGGCTDLIDVRDKGYEDWSPMAAAGELSPYSRTSATWPHSRAPFKPEIVMEAGNRAVNKGKTEALTVHSLSLLSTGNDMTRSPLVPFHATSAAAAQAARLAGRLTADHPQFWPETIRGLIVHSADWTKPMLDAFDARTARRRTMSWSAALDTAFLITNGRQHRRTTVWLCLRRPISSLSNSRAAVSRNATTTRFRSRRTCWSVWRTNL